MPIKIALVEDVSSVVKGSADAAKSFEDVADSLDDLARDAQRAGDKTGDALSDGVKDGTKDSESSLDKLTRSFKDMTSDVSTQTRKVGDDLGDNVKRGTHDAEGGLSEFKDEAASTARETAASFDGSADSIAGSFQEVAANALGGFGPLGAAAGLAAAAGIGVLWSSIQEGSEKAAQQVSDAFDDMVESGNEFLSAELINQRMRDIIQGNEEAVASYDRIKDVATRTGADIGLVLRAYAGDQDASNALIDAANQKMQDIKDKYQGGVLSDAARHDRGILSGVVSDLESVQGATDSAAKQYDAYAQGVQLGNKHVATSADEARAMYDGLGRSIASLPKEVTVAVNADLTQAKRQIKALTDATYTVTVNGKATGVKYY